MYNNVSVYAYGGAGGSSGKYELSPDQSGTGAGGYSAGLSEDMISYNYASPSNGRTGSHVPTGIYSNGGSYFEHGKVSPSISSEYAKYGSNKGGQAPGDFQYTIGATQSVMTCCVGGGGIAGKGGKVKVSANSKVYAYNGNECTLKESDDGYYYQPLSIYIQSGEPLDVYIHNGCAANARYEILKKALNCTILGWYEATGISDYKDFVITKNMRGYSYEATSYGQGIGSGAVYIEVSNGTYTVDSSMN